MNFAFDEDQISLGDAVARLLADHADLLAPGLDGGFHDAAWQGLADLGLFALLVPEEFGGVGLAAVDLALAVEALGAALAPACVTSTLLATDLLVHHGTAAQQLDILPQIATGKLRVAIAMLEEGQGYDPQAVTSEVRAGRLSGSKILAPDAGVANLFLVLAQSNNGPALWLVAPDAAGVSCQAHDDIDPTSGLCALHFDGCVVDDAALIGAAAPARAIARLVDTGATFAAGMMTGIAACMLAKAVEYAKTRVQFGQAIGSFQSIKHRCADMAVAVDAACSATYYAFWAVAEDAADQARASSMAKAYAGDVVRQVCNETIQIHGGMGFTWELALHRFLRRARVLEHMFGATAWHHERVLVETLAGLEREQEQSRNAA